MAFSPLGVYVGKTVPLSVLYVTAFATIDCQFLATSQSLLNLAPLSILTLARTPHFA